VSSCLCTDGPVPAHCLIATTLAHLDLHAGVPYCTACFALYSDPFNGAAPCLPRSSNGLVHVHPLGFQACCSSCNVSPGVSAPLKVGVCVGAMQQQLQGVDEPGARLSCLWVEGAEVHVPTRTMHMDPTPAPLQRAALEDCPRPQCVHGTPLRQIPALLSSCYWSFAAVTCDMARGGKVRLLWKKAHTWVQPSFCGLVARLTVANQEAEVAGSTADVRCYIVHQLCYLPPSGLLDSWFTCRFQALFTGGPGWSAHINSPLAADQMCPSSRDLSALGQQKGLASTGSGALQLLPLPKLLTPQSHESITHTCKLIGKQPSRLWSNAAGGVTHSWEQQGCRWSFGGRCSQPALWVTAIGVLLKAILPSTGTDV
jgi:hypothetical protein